MPSTREDNTDLPALPATKTEQQVHQLPASSSQKFEAALSREDWIEILTEALDRSSQREETRKRPRGKSPHPEESEEEDDNNRALGSLSASVVSSGSGKKARQPQQHPPPSETYKPRKSAAGSASSAKQAAAWKKKLAALQKAQLQLSNKISALIDLSSE